MQSSNCHKPEKCQDQPAERATPPNGLIAGLCGFGFLATPFFALGAILVLMHSLKV